MATNIEPRNFLIADAVRYSGISRSRIYELVAAGELELGKLHGRSVIRKDVLDAHIEKNYRKAG